MSFPKKYLFMQALSCASKPRVIVRPSVDGNHTSGATFNNLEIAST